MTALTQQTPTLAKCGKRKITMRSSSPIMAPLLTMARLLQSGPKTKVYFPIGTYSLSSGELPVFIDFGEALISIYTPLKRSRTRMQVDGDKWIEDDGDERRR